MAIETRIETMTKFKIIFVHVCSCSELMSSPGLEGQKVAEGVVVADAFSCIWFEESWCAISARKSSKWLPPLPEMKVEYLDKRRNSNTLQDVNGSNFSGWFWNSEQGLWLAVFESNLFEVAAYHSKEQVLFIFHVLVGLLRMDSLCLLTVYHAYFKTQEQLAITRIL